MRCPVVVGRSVEQEALDSLVAGAARGDGGTLALVGEAGIGKSRLVEHALGATERRHLLGLIGRCTPGSVPLQSIREVLLDGTRGLSPPVDDPELAPYLAVLGGLVPHWRPADPAGGSDHPTVVAESVLRCLVHLAGDDGAVVVLEDLHWADLATCRVVEYLADRLHGRRLALVLTARDDETGLTHIPHRVAHVRLTPLDREQVGQMAALCRPDEPVDVERLLAVSAGLPLVVEDALAGAGPGRRFAEVVDERLGSLTATDRPIIEVAAVLGEEVDTELTAVAASCPVSLAQVSIERAVEVGLLTDDRRGLRFRHALTRDAVLASLRSPRLAALSAEAARAILERRPVSSTYLMAAAEHLVVAGRNDDAVTALDEASRSAGDERRLDIAAAALRRAVDLARSDRSRWRRFALAASNVLLEVGDLAEAQAAAEDVVALSVGEEPAAEVAAWQVLARIAMLGGRWDEAGDHLARARRVGVVSSDASISLDVLHARLALGRGRPGDRALAAHVASAAAVAAREAGQPELESEAWLIAGLADRASDLDRSAEVLGRAFEVARSHGATRLRLEIQNELGATELLRDATTDRLERALEEAERSGAIGLATSIRVNLTAVYLMTARFEEAAASAERVEDSASVLGLVPLAAVSYLHRGQAAGLCGDGETMERYLQRAEELAPEDGDLRAAAWAVGRGLHALITEDRDAARRAFARAREVGPDIHVSFLDPFEGPDLLLQALDGETSVAECRAALGQSVSGARYHEMWLNAALAVAAGSAGDHESATTALATALTAGDRYPVFSAIIGRIVGEAQVRDGWGQPATLLRSAELEYHQRGLVRSSAACRGLLRKIGAAAPRRRSAERLLPARLLGAGVTNREAEVLDLLADRLTDKQIAERLYCSPRTVEKHVASLKSKLQTDRIGLSELAKTLAIRFTANRDRGLNT